MNDLIYYIAFGLGSYLLGGVPFGLFLGKLNGIDIRLEGSGNIGATNVGRCCGKPWGIVCFLLDFCKGAGPVLLAVTYGPKLGDVDKELIGVIAAIATVCGHCFSPFLKFKGGKGIATSAGAIGILAPFGVIGAFIVWVLVLALFRYVGLASVCAAIALPVSEFTTKYLKDEKPGSITLGMLVFIAMLAVFRHKSNIKRLLQGTEPKIGQPKDTEDVHSHENSSA